MKFNRQMKSFYDYLTTRFTEQELGEIKARIAQGDYAMSIAESIESIEISKNLWRYYKNCENRYLKLMRQLEELASSLEEESSAHEGAGEAYQTGFCALRIRKILEDSNVK